MKKIVLIFAILRALILLISNPKRTQEFLRLAKTMHWAGLYETTIERLKSDPQTRALFGEKYTRGYLDIHSLSQLAPGTLGKEFVEFVRRNELDPNYFFDPERKIKTDHDYYEVRLRETHDIWHVILGQDTDEAGEIGVQGFMLAQFSPPMSAFIVGGAFFRTILKFPAKIFSYTQALSRGFQTGVAAPQFMGMKWEEHWTENLDSLRARLKVAVR